MATKDTRLARVGVEGYMAFTLAINGAAAAYGASTTLLAEEFFRMCFVQATNSWYRIT